MQTIFLAGLLTFVLFCLALAFKPSRKALGVILCVLGGIECLSGILLLIGLPTIFFGALLLFI